MVLLGCKPEGRNTEQHDVFFGMAFSLRDLIPQMIDFWPEAKSKIHIDGWRTIERVGQYEIVLVPRVDISESKGDELSTLNLFFVNLGGYKEGELQEFHKGVLVVAHSLEEAQKIAKTDGFYLNGQSVSGPAARSHVDDKYEVDDIVNLSEAVKGFCIVIKHTTGSEEEVDLHLGYQALSKI